MAVCSKTDCTREQYPASDNCILHCEKSDHATDFSKTGFLESFYNELIEYIANEIDSKNHAIPHNRSELISLFKNEQFVKKASVQNAVRKHPFTFSGILFPARKNTDTFDYFKLLNTFNEFSFNNCSFTVGDFDLLGRPYFFTNCTFFHNLNIFPQDTLNNQLPIFTQCTYYGDVNVGKEAIASISITNILFCDCDFKTKLRFTNTFFERPIFANSDSFSSSISQIEIAKCTIGERFILNNYAIESFKIEDSVFRQKVEFKYGTVKQFYVNNTNFEMLADFYKKTFTNFHIKKSIFRKFVVFEECTFGEPASQSGRAAEFTYVTFLNYVNFRYATFIGGLILSRANLSNPPNFFGADINYPNTDRETFRIIKHSFDQVGNTIEANKYFSEEMKKQKEELEGNPNKRSELWIYKINEFISDFGQSYLRPIGLSILLTFVAAALKYTNEHNWLYKYFGGGEYTNSIAVFVNGIALGFTPLARFLVPGMEFLSFLFYILFSILIWQTIVAVKRHTRR